MDFNLTKSLKNSLLHGTLNIQKLEDDHLLRGTLQIDFETKRLAFYTGGKEMMWLDFAEAGDHGQVHLHDVYLTVRIS